MQDSYYPRHGGEQGASSEDLHIAWLEDRVALLEKLLVEARVTLGPCQGCLSGCLGQRIDEAMRSAREAN